MFKNLFSKEMVMSAVSVGLVVAAIWAIHDNMPNGFKIKALSTDAA